VRVTVGDRHRPEHRVNQEDGLALRAADLRAARPDLLVGDPELRLAFRAGDDHPDPLGKSRLHPTALDTKRQRQKQCPEIAHLPPPRTRPMNEERTPEADPAAGREPKVIKRYTNRKLYDTVESRYVTLDEIAEMIKAGAEVKIIDNRTKDDLTSVTLAQIIFEEEKKTSKMSLETLRDMIRQGGAVAQRLVEGTQEQLRGRVEAVRAAAEQRVQSIMASGQRTSDRAKELVQASQDAVGMMQKKVDERVRAAMEGMSSLSDVRRSLDDVSRRIEALEKRLDELAKK
jgi:polyhydroxyalkanoate synthesis repressor PhaR